jgi:phage regulator Rha-like protein
MSKKNNGFTYKDGVSLKEFFLVKFDSLDKALELQAKEYERRLSDLNHEAEQLKSMQSTYMPRELYENNHEVIRKQIDELILNKAKLEGKADQDSVNRVFIISVAGILVSIVAVIIHWLK